MNADLLSSDDHFLKECCFPVLNNRRTQHFFHSVSQNGLDSEAIEYSRITAAIMVSLLK